MLKSLWEKKEIYTAVLILTALSGSLAGSVIKAEEGSNDIELTRFAVIGDYGNDTPTEKLVADLVDSFKIEFIITTGDNSYGDANIDDNIGKYYSKYIGNYAGKYGKGSQTNRFFPALGNHDYDDGGGITAYESYFTLPGKSIRSSNSSGSERYYDFIQGPVHFFVIDSDEGSVPPGGIPSTSKQGVWLKQQLALSTSPWKIVYMHQPPYTSGKHESNIKMQWPYEEWGITAVIAGHNHIYERIMRDDNNDNIQISYIVNGLGGFKLHKLRDPLPGTGYRYNKNHGAMLVEACTSSITFSFFTANSNTLIDKYTMGEPVCR